MTRPPRYYANVNRSLLYWARGNRKRRFSA